MQDAIYISEFCFVKACILYTRNVLSKISYLIYTHVVTNNSPEMLHLSHFHLSVVSVIEYTNLVIIKC